MRRLPSLLLLGIGLFATAACRGPARQPEQALRPAATIKDIMNSIVDPAADFLWESVATVIDSSGTTEHQPRTDEEWANLRRRAVELVEATNLLVMEGRHVARPGEKAEDAQVELSPEEIEQAINKDRRAWVGFAHGLYDAALPALQAIDARNIQGLFDAGERIDTACENCHLKYWYPLSHQEKAAAARKQNP